MNTHLLNETESLIVEKFFQNEAHQSFQNPVFTSFF